MDSQRIRNRIFELLDHGNQILENIGDERTTRGHYIIMGRELQDVVHWRASCINLIRSTVGTENFFYSSFPADYENHSSRNIETYIHAGLGILTSLSDEINAGLITDLKSIVAADLLISIQEQTDALLQANYKDAAAVYCRIMLESFLKKICDKNEIPHTNRSTINPLAESLRNEEVINIVEWRQILSWADIGNNAAHGDFHTYSRDDVQRMNEGILDLIKKHLQS